MGRDIGRDYETIGSRRIKSNPAETMEVRATEDERRKKLREKKKVGQVFSRVTCTSGPPIRTSAAWNEVAI